MKTELVYGMRWIALLVLFWDTWEGRGAAQATNSA